jgi:aminoglycoside phosphotransferase (APT) family kinase protein
MDKHDEIAAVIFQRHGLSFETAERAGGWTNFVWLNGDFALRLSKEKGSDRIRRETERSKILPLSVGYPTNITTGVTDEYEWSLSKRIQGKVLSEVWKNLSWTEKAAAVKQIFGLMKDVHSVEVGKVEHLTLRKAWYNPFNIDESLADIERYVAQKIFTIEQGRVLRGILEQFYKWHYRITPVLNHGDITMDNLLWHDGNVVSLLDFEHSVIAPQQLDLHSLVNLALVPYDEVSSTDVVLMAEKNSEIQQYVSEIVPLFKTFLSKQCDKDLFLGYSILFRQRFLEFWLEEPEGELAVCDAYQKLISLIDGNGGYLADLLKG